MDIIHVLFCKALYTTYNYSVQQLVSSQMHFCCRYVIRTYLLQTYSQRFIDRHFFFGVYYQSLQQVHNTMTKYLTYFIIRIGVKCMKNKYYNSAIENHSINHQNSKGQKRVKLYQGQKFALYKTSIQPDKSVQTQQKKQHNMLIYKLTFLLMTILTEMVVSTIFKIQQKWYCKLMMINNKHSQRMNIYIILMYLSLILFCFPVFGIVPQSQTSHMYLSWNYIPILLVVSSIQQQTTWTYVPSVIQRQYRYCMTDIMSIRKIFVIDKTNFNQSKQVFYKQNLIKLLYTF
eukprot:TRINITY_DN11411_c0_g2_i2.p1 TRINITY_DN11411_c0_g2~~TRINITY_DN11411_c0_g2_i2.p1  ORF type:complete len:288 (+),score=-27.81 TRINITY_DN11411_c0_g2_i2:332-1195(+)